MKKLSLPYPLKNDGTSNGQTYRLWKKELPVKSPDSQIKQATAKPPVSTSKKPWWKFW